MELTEMLQQINIVDYISQYVDLEKRGDEWWGLSCFTNEKTPSFSVREDPPVFYDYSSGIGGNLYTFVRYYNKVDGRKAVEILEKYSGIDASSLESGQKLSATAACKKYLPKKRTEKKINPKFLPDDYMLRYVTDPAKLQIWRDEGISDLSMAKFCVRYDPFSDRIVYPVRDLDGRIVNVCGRTLDPLFKEHNQKKYCYFFPWNGALCTIYGLFENKSEILKKREVILFEGCKSVLKADTWGIGNTAAILTSHLSPYQMTELAKLGCTVVFALDKDVDIRKDHNINKLKQYVNVQYIFDKDNMLDEKDSPVDKGEAVFRELYANRISLK